MATKVSSLLVPAIGGACCPAPRGEAPLSVRAKGRADGSGGAKDAGPECQCVLSTSGHDKGFSHSLPI